MKFYHFHFYHINKRCRWLPIDGCHTTKLTIQDTDAAVYSPSLSGLKAQVQKTVHYTNELFNVSSVEDP